MRAILIDPYNRTITEVDNEHWPLDTIYKTLGKGVDCITCIQLDGDALYLDDEGLLKEAMPIWRLDVYKAPLAGRGLILGVDEEGDVAPAKTDLELLKAHVTWTDQESTGHLTPATEYREPGGFVIIGGEGILRKRETRQ